MRLLLAEDEQDLSRPLGVIFKHNNYSVDIVENGNDALEFGLTNEYDGIILDIMMPGMSGLEVLKTLRKNGINTPILMLTAKGEIEDRIEGLDAGADDYLPKPFNTGELLARVRSMTRRKNEFRPNELKVGDITLKKETSELKCGEEAVRLTNKEFQMLEMLMLNTNRLISTEYFLEKIWGLDTESEINVVWTYISNLRKKLAKVNSNLVLQASRGTGYTLVSKDIDVS